jgi:hypothetical protein
MRSISLRSGLLTFAFIFMEEALRIVSIRWDWIDHATWILAEDGGLISRFDSGIMSLRGRRQLLEVVHFGTAFRRTFSSGTYPRKQRDMDSSREPR